MVLDSLIGREFTRLKYGPQKWKKKIRHVFYEAKFTDNPNFRSVRVMIVAEDGSGTDDVVATGPSEPTRASS